jgi:hypothetical protein
MSVISWPMPRKRSRKQDLLADQFFPIWVYYLAKELKAGRPACKDPEWWKHGWHRSKVTVDIAGTARSISSCISGMIPSNALGACRVQWRPEIDKYLDERNIIDGIAAHDLRPAFPPSPAPKAPRGGVEDVALAEIPQTGEDTSEAPATEAKAELGLSTKEFMKLSALFSKPSATVNVPEIKAPPPGSTRSPKIRSKSAGNNPIHQRPGRPSNDP